MQSEQLKQEKLRGDNLTETHPYHSLLTPLIQRLSQLFEIPPPSPNTVQVECSFPFSISLISCNVHPIYQYRYEFPCSVNTYIQMLRDCSLQKDMDVNTDEFRVIDQVDDQTEVMYLCYKKVLILQSRDFIYVRHRFNSIDGCTWVIATSLPDKQAYPPKLRGSILLSATRIKPLSANSIRVQVHSQVDMRMVLKQQMARGKGFAEIKKYVIKMYETISKDKEKL